MTFDRLVNEIAKLAVECEQDNGVEIDVLMLCDLPVEEGKARAFTVTLKLHMNGVLH